MHAYTVHAPHQNVMEQTSRTPHWQTPHTATVDRTTPVPTHMLKAQHRLPTPHSMNFGCMRLKCATSSHVHAEARKAVAAAAEDPRLARVERDRHDTMEVGDRVQLQRLDGHDEGVGQQVGVDHAVEDLHGAVVGAGREERVPRVEVHAAHNRAVVLHHLVRLRREVQVEPAPHPAASGRCHTAQHSSRGGAHACMHAAAAILPVRHSPRRRRARRMSASTADMRRRGTVPGSAIEWSLCADSPPRLHRLCPLRQREPVVQQLLRSLDTDLLAPTLLLSCGSVTRSACTQPPTHGDTRTPR